MAQVPDLTQGPANDPEVVEELLQCLRDMKSEDIPSGPCLVKGVMTDAATLIEYLLEEKGKE